MVMQNFAEENVFTNIESKIKSLKNLIVNVLNARSPSIKDHLRLKLLKVDWYFVIELAKKLHKKLGELKKFSHLITLMLEKIIELRLKKIFQTVVPNVDMTNTQKFYRFITLIEIGQIMILKT